MITIAAKIPAAIIPMVKTMNSMTTIQSASPIEIAAKSERNWLLTLVGWIVISAIITAFLTILVYRKTGKYQQALKLDADARIKEADSKAAIANENAGTANERAGRANERASRADERAGKANERAGELEKEAAQARKDVAILQRYAADALAEQQRVQILLAEQQARTAKAEQALETERTARLQLEAFNTPRQIVNPSVMVDALKSFKGTDVIIEYAPDSDSTNLAGELSWFIREAGWEVVEITKKELFPNIMVRAPFVMYESRASDAAVALLSELKANGVNAEAAPTNRRKDTVIIEIGPKEATYLAAKQRAELRREFLFRDPKNPQFEALSTSATFSHFNAEQQGRFAKEMERLPKEGEQPTVQIRCPAADDEACALAKDIGLLVRNVGWRLQDNGLIRDPDFPSIARDLQHRFPELGVRVVVAARWKEERFLFSWVLTDALRATGLTVQRTTEIFDPAAPILVAVYSKQKSKK